MALLEKVSNLLFYSNYGYSSYKTLVGVPICALYAVIATPLLSNVTSERLALEVCIQPASKGECSQMVLYVVAVTIVTRISKWPEVGFLFDNCYPFTSYNILWCNT